MRATVDVERVASPVTSWKTDTVSCDAVHGRAVPRSIKSSMRPAAEENEGGRRGGRVDDHGK